MPSFDPRESLIFLTIRVGKLLANHLQKQDRMAGQDFPPHCMGVLVDLWTEDGVRQQDLAISTIKNKASITRALDILEAHNIALRIPDPADKRTKRIYLTHKGKQLKHDLMPLADQAVAEAVQGLSREDVNTCKRVLHKMYENLNKKLQTQPK